MKIIIKILLGINLLWLVMSCSSTKNGMDIINKTMELNITKIQNEMDGQTLFLKDDDGDKYKTIISPANGNFVNVVEGDRISLTVKDFIKKSKPLQIISQNIKIMGKINYEKTEEETFWINSRKVKANGNWGRPMDCLQFQKGETLNKQGKWETLCENIENFNYVEGKYYQVKVLKKWHENHESLMDASPYDLELITVVERVEDTTYVSPIKTKITTNKSAYSLGEAIEVAMEVKNTSDKPYTFLPWGTPIENRFTRNSLTVMHNGKQIPYSGIMVKRIPPTEKDYITLKKDETANGTVNLLDGYKLTEKGTYTIQFEETYKGMPASNTLKLEIE